MLSSPIVLLHTLSWLGASVAKVTTPQMLSALQQMSADWSYPKIIEIAQGVNYSGFSSDIVGRADVTNTFLGNELNTEYIFGMFASLSQSKTTSLIGWPLKQTIKDIVTFGNTVSYSAIVEFNWTVEVVPTQFNVFMVLNEEGKFSQYDAQFVRATWLFQYMLPKLVPRLARELGLPNTTDPIKLATKRAALDICAIHDMYCRGKLQQYKSHAQCIDFIENKRPFGDMWQAGQDTGICRYWHQGMVRYRPEVHCYHIGPSGGDMCIHRDYINETIADPFPTPFVSYINDTTHSTTKVIRA